MKVIILAGGSGMRLWPVSRVFNPKQFTKFKGMGKSTFQNTVEKAISVANINNIIVVTNVEYKYFVLGQIKELGLSIPTENVILEPSFKNTLHAVSTGVFEFVKRGVEKSRILVIHANSIVSDYAELFKKIEVAKEMADTSIVTFGVGIDNIDTGYGYIKTGEPFKSGFKVTSFVEKPTKTDAEFFQKDGYYFNSGILLFTISAYMEQLKMLEPELYELLIDGDIMTTYEYPSNLTVEKAILERTNILSVVVLSEKWRSINEFSNFYRQYIDKKDENGNISFNNDIFIDSKNNFIYTDTDKAIGVIGVEDLVVIDQDDALLICRSSDTSKVSLVAKALGERHDPRVEYHTTAYRPWGAYTILEEREGYKIKRITVLSKNKLSYQLHYHRSEHWVVVRGVAKVTIEGEEKIVRAGESRFISAGEKHRMENPGNTLLEIIEVQIGSYLGEDDIVRFEDDFGREKC